MNADLAALLRNGDKPENKYFERITRQLPEQQSRVIKLCKINGLSYAEAAKELNITPGS